MKPSLFILSIILLSIGVFGQESCTTDCANQPYKICYNKISRILDGIFVDTAQNKLVFAVYLDNQQLSNRTIWGQKLYLASVPLANPNFLDYSVIHELDNTRISFFYAYHPSKSIPWFAYNIDRSQSGIAIYDPNTDISKTIYTELWGGVNQGFATQGDVFYKCSQDRSSVQKFNQPPTNNFNDFTVISNGGCSGITASGSNIVYFNTTFDSPSSSFYRITPSGQTELMFTVPYTVRYIQSSNNVIFYTNTDGSIYKVPFNAPYTQTQIATVTRYIGGFQYYDNKLYFKTDLNIYMIDLNNNNALKLVFGANPEGGENFAQGRCYCTPGFSGNNCQSCPSNFVRWRDSVPTCVKKLDNGFPARCIDNWECGNQPYAFCGLGICRCSGGLTNPPSCTGCNGNIYWDYGVPYCNVSSS
ncbi:hypothetical protein CYY_005040 [Polysphondylium violaceum]|uniref:EGF-like domain-containing protein n=1 Tax=Polysphondylium violaceum TaxID=133409 RepID=A0A8J4PUY0_9MYCE|nr:hypothetical protein CYY_005040 [Polysphondylium violaceum]